MTIILSLNDQQGGIQNEQNISSVFQRKRYNRETGGKTGKMVIPFATSGGSGMGSTNKDLAVSCGGAVLKEGKRFPSNAGEAELKAWAEKLM